MLICHSHRFHICCNECGTCDKLLRCHTCHIIHMWAFPHGQTYPSHMYLKYEVDNRLGGRLDYSKCDMFFIPPASPAKIWNTQESPFNSRWAPPWPGQRSPRATPPPPTMRFLGHLDASHGEETSMDGKQVIFLTSSQFFHIFALAGSIRESQAALGETNFLR